MEGRSYRSREWAGKGHERAIIGPDGEQPWDEAAVATELLAEMGYRR